jgi:hypothetical protein
VISISANSNPNLPSTQRPANRCKTACSQSHAPGLQGFFTVFLRVFALFIHVLFYTGGKNSCWRLHMDVVYIILIVALGALTLGLVAVFGRLMSGSEEKR